MEKTASLLMYKSASLLTHFNAGKRNDFLRNDCEASQIHENLITALQYWCFAASLHLTHRGTKRPLLVALMTFITTKNDIEKPVFVIS
jgi:hypothetical protein